MATWPPGIRRLAGSCLPAAGLARRRRAPTAFVGTFLATIWRDFSRDIPPASAPRSRPYFPHCWGPSDVKNRATIRRQDHLTFRGNLSHTRYGWLRLTPAYSVHQVESLLTAQEKNSVVFDPFCGTGTTALVC